MLLSDYGHVNIRRGHGYHGYHGRVNGDHVNDDHGDRGHDDHGRANF